MNVAYLILVMISISPFFEDVYAQSINVNATTPCFLNYTAGIHLWQNCGIQDDWLAMTLLPFEWITGGYFTMIIIAIIILMVYMKYQKTIYAIVIGMVFFPISYAFFPADWMSFVVVMVGLSIGMMIYFGIKRQTD